jgi:glycosyltransferase involved in cell wall biosynthesis
VRFVPRYVTEAEMPALFRRADIVVLPYVRTDRYDFSGVLATALAFARPTVVSDVGGFAEVARHGAIELVAPGEPEALRETLRRLLADPDHRDRLAAAAARAAAGEFSWSRAAERTLELYRSIRAERYGS